jgi:RNA-directed DNA polymerase
MTVMAKPVTGAPPASMPAWNSIDWKKAVTHVRQLQMRIAKAYREGKHGKVKALQWILTHSHSAKLFAVKRVVQNDGAKSPGVDNIVWNTSDQKLKAALSLKRHGYKTKPLKRIYIPKKQKGKLRPLSIPVMECRAQQALYLLALEPVSEMIADKNAYGFRPLRSTADAIEQCFKSLVKQGSAKYVLEGDIKSCFDNISSEWLLKNVIIDTEMLRKWLAAGYIENGKLYSTDRGTPQGGVISPTLLNVTLSGLEKAVKTVIKTKDRVNVCVYADDFVITGATKEVLEKKVKPVVENFLRERGLSLSQEKTKITHINEGFDFLGMNIRKYNGKLLIKPAKSSVKRFIADIRETIKINKTAKTENLIRLLNPKIRGWANYYRHVCSKKTFSFIDHKIFEAIWRWSVRRHRNKGLRWIKKKYFRTSKSRNWIFSAKIKSKDGGISYLDLLRMDSTPIRRHIKFRAEATPFNPIHHAYLEKRICNRHAEKETKPRLDWWQCWWSLLKPKTLEGKHGLTSAL